MTSCLFFWPEGSNSELTPPPPAQPALPPVPYHSEWHHHLPTCPGVKLRIYPGLLASFLLFLDFSLLFPPKLVTRSCPVYYLSMSGIFSLTSIPTATTQVQATMIPHQNYCIGHLIGLPAFRHLLSPNILHIAARKCKSDLSLKSSGRSYPLLQ